MKAVVTNLDLPIFHRYAAVPAVRLAFMAIDAAGSLAEYVFKQLNKSRVLFCETFTYIDIVSLFCIRKIEIIRLSTKRYCIRRRIILKLSDSLNPLFPVSFWINYL